MIDPTGHRVQYDPGEPLNSVDSLERELAYEDRMVAVLEAMRDTLGAMLGHMVRIERRVDELDARRGASSVEIKTSTRGADVAIKVYDGSPVQYVADTAIDEYARVVASINQRLVDAINR